MGDLAHFALDQSCVICHPFSQTFFIVKFSLSNSFFLSLILIESALSAPPPIEEIKDEPVTYLGNEDSDKRWYHGGFRSAVGVHKIQVYRATRNQPLEGDSVGWTYNHAPMLAYWEGRSVRRGDAGSFDGTRSLLSRERVDIDGLFSQVDLMPTLLELMGLKVSGKIDGDSRAGQFGKDSPQWAENIVVEWNDPVRPEEEGRSIVTADGWKLNLYRSSPPELFNLNTDPSELVNQVEEPDNLSRVSTMKSSLKAWQKRTGDSLEFVV